MPTLPSKFVDMESANLINNSPSRKDQLPNLKTYTRAIEGAQRWEFDFRTPRFGYEEAMELYSFVCSLNGSYVVFDLPNPMPVVGVNTNTPTAANSISSGASAMAINGLTANQQKALMPGDFVRFANHSKVYMVTDRIDASGAGQGSLLFYPDLKEDVPASTAIEHGEAVEFTVMLENDIQDLLVSAKQDLLTTIAISVVEDV